MKLPTAYLMTTKNVRSIFDSLINAKAPESFTQKFLEGLGFTSSNDRLYIGVLKGIGFLDENSTPTETYFRFLDQTESKRVLAEAIENSYEDLFMVNKDAQNLEVSEIKNKLKTLTQGRFSDNVIGLMASTFKALCEYAEWKKEKVITSKKAEPSLPEKQEIPIEIHVEEEVPVTPRQGIKNKEGKPEFHYNIQIHLPESRDEAVYDAIFKSLTRHLL